MKAKRGGKKTSGRRSLKRVDLHVHSSASDGTVAPEELPLRAEEAGLDLIALTDHDTTAGLPAFLEQSRLCGIPALAGIELSAEAPFTLHILGYGIDVNCPSLEGQLQRLRERRNERNEAIRLRLADLGLPLSPEAIEEEADGEVVARPHIARALMRRGYVSDMASAFQRFLGQGAPAYVPRVRLDAESCLQAIDDAGGVAALAHPIQTGLDDEGLMALLRRLRGAGLWGLECYSPHHGAEERLRFLSMAFRFGLTPTAGSDFHGDNRPGVELGVTVDEALFPFDFLVRLAARQEEPPLIWEEGD